jgi:hypothetical protein
MRRFAVVLLIALVACGAAGATRAAAPTNTVILATFVPERFLTMYELRFPTTDRSKKVTGQWHLTAPANDKGCDLFVPHKMTRSAAGPGFVFHATWLHGDQHRCHHERMGPRGHQGTVRLVFADTKWRCSASHLGTNSGATRSQQTFCRPV